MDEAAFEDVVREALDLLPPEFAQHLQNIEVFVAARPSAEQRRAAGIKPWQTLYGLYEGVPLTRRGSSAPPMPDTITIFREPLLRGVRGRAALREQIRHTVLHEIAHFFGISDDRLRELDAY